MSTDFKTTLVEDARLMLHDKLDYEVYSGASSITTQRFQANSLTPSVINFNVQVPSLESVVDMNAMIETDIIFTISGNVAAGGSITDLINYSVTDVLAPFVFNQLISNINCSINGAQVSVNSSDLLSSLLTLVGRDTLSKYNNSTPTMLDNIQSYASAGYSTSQASVFGNYLSSNKWDNQPRGAYPISIVYTGSPVPAGGGAASAVVTVHVCEPIIGLSPFTMAKESVGCSGISQMNFNLSMDSSASRAWRRTALSAVPAYNLSVSYANAYVNFNFLTPKPSQLVKYSPRNVMPYTELMRYSTSSTSIASGAEVPITTASIQLNSIPRMAMLFARSTDRTLNTADWFLPISNCSINFNNRSSLLANAQVTDLYRFSVESGVNLSYPEWLGVAGGAAGAGVNTVGSVLALTFGKHLEISDDYLSVGSMGAFNFQATVKVKNTSAAAVNVSLYLVVAYDGLFSTERGSSSTFTSILNKQSVLDCVSSGDAVPDSSIVDVPLTPSETLTGGRRRAVGMGRSGGGRSGGAVKSKLHSRLM